MFTPLLKSLQNNEELIHWKKKQNPEGLFFLELSRGCSEKVTYEKDDEVERARRRLSENMIRINVYFGYKFFVIKILSVHTILRIVIFDLFSGILSLLTLVSFLGCVGGKKSMCLLQHKGNGHAVFVFVAAGRSDQAPQSVSTQCHSVISL